MSSACSSIIIDIKTLRKKREIKEKEIYEMKLKNCFVIFILVFVFSATTALASVIEYTETTSFNAAISGATTYNFESSVAPSQWTQGNPNVP